MNRNLSCIIVDDEPAGIKLIEAFVTKIPYLEHKGSFDNPDTALKFLKKNHADILITDIQMPGLTGLEMVRSLTIAPEVIFTTAHRDFAADGFDVNAADYLLKPLNFERFHIAINKVRDRLQSQWSFGQQRKDYLFIKKERSFLKLSFDEIAYLEASGDFVKIFRIDGSSITTRGKLSDMESNLPLERFIKAHKSFIVNMSMIHSINQFRICLNNGTEIPVSKGFKNVVSKRMGII